MLCNKYDLLKAKPIEDMLTDKMKTSVTSFGLTEAGYDIRIKQDIEFTFAEEMIENNHSKLNRSKKITRIYDPYTGELQVIDGWFTLASTIERFTMPTYLTGVVHDKSTWARQGLSVFNTVIEAGWEGWLTLELVYHGTESLYIPSGTGIAQVLFHLMQNKAQYEGKYQGQANKPIESIFDNKVNR